MKLRPGSGAAAADSTGEMSLFEHLAELRMRIVRAGLAIMLGAILVMAFYDQVLRRLTEPYRALCERKGPAYCGLEEGQEVSLVILDPIEGFSTRLKISFYGGLILGLPVVLWQLWKFIVPALHKNEKRYAFGFVISTVTLFLCGGFIAFLTLEAALDFLIGWAGEGVTPEFRVQAYVRLVTLMVFAFGVGFTIPVLLVFMQLIGMVKPGQLLGAWRYAIVGIFFLAAAITPSGDPISLLALSLPMTVLYFVAILIGWIIHRRRRSTKA
ncbi:MAG TPA: twin-arginine translocase subunit TatC [Ilumatobacter sp.]|nr:twin-arginine translocase subunit TatC [Ilumatobacter sp.]